MWHGVMATPVKKACRMYGGNWRCGYSYENNVWLLAYCVGVAEHGIWRRGVSGINGEK